MRLIVSGIIYLLGVAIILVLKPDFMFQEDGVWKEFGIGRNTKTHTWFPFWLFIIVWAIISYFITVLLLPMPGTTPNLEVQTGTVKIPKRRRIREPIESVAPTPDLASGYYMLNSENSGVPRYVYLGPKEPAD